MAGKIVSKIQTRTKENTVGVIIAIVVLLVILLVVAISLKFASDDRSRNLGEDPSDETSLQESKRPLVENASTNSARILVERGVTADEKHYSIEMIVSADSRKIRVLRGYEQIEERTETLPNNLEAYRAFLQALQRYNFTEAREDKSGFSYREACPTQRSYVFSLMDGSSQEFERWHEFCEGKRFGTYGGRVNLTFSLFRNQFPNYSAYTKGLTL